MYKKPLKIVQITIVSLYLLFIIINFTFMNLPAGMILGFTTFTLITIGIVNTIFKEKEKQ